VLTKNAARERIALGRRMRQLDLPMVLVSAAALILVGPLRGAFLEYPPIPFASTLFLFMVPGALLANWFMGERFWGAALVPVSFVISTGLFGLLAVPVLMLEGSLDVYLWMAGAITAAFLVAAAIRTFRLRAPTEDDVRRGDSSWWLWIPFLLLGAVLAFASRLRVPGVNEDIWVYLAYVRDFLSTDKLALYEPYFGNETGLSRVKIDGWLLEQAAFSRISGIDPVELVFDFLAPTLVIIALLAFYTLARTLLKSEAAALLAGCLCALFFLVNLNYTFYSFGGELIGRVAEDKFVARFLFLPVALAFAFVFLESRRRRYLVAFTFTCSSVMTAHPVGLAIVGLSVGGFGLAHVAVNWGKREAWADVASLGVALLSVVIIPALLVFVATGESLIAVLSEADINSNDPDVLANMTFVRPRWKHVYELEDGSYIMHPTLVLDPVILGALLLGTPFLVRRLRGNLSAQLLLGVLFLSVFVCYVPPVATFVGDHIVLPGQLWRLAWPIPLAALLTVGWMAWEATRRAEAGLGRLGAGRVTRLVPLVLVIAMASVVTPTAVDGVDGVHRTDKEIMKHPAYVFDPIFYWMRDNIREPSVVLAPDAENTCIPAYSASANVVSLRGRAILDRLPALERRAQGRIEVPQRAVDVRKFYRDSSPEEKAEILHHYDVDYVMLRVDSPLRKFLESRSGFTEVETPGDWYRLYAVDLQRLGASSSRPGDGFETGGATLSAHLDRPASIQGSMVPSSGNFHRATSERLSA
jgi:hypothetical protein